MYEMSVEHHCNGKNTVLSDECLLFDGMSDKQYVSLKYRLLLFFEAVPEIAFDFVSSDKNE